MTLQEIRVNTGRMRADSRQLQEYLGKAEEHLARYQEQMAALDRMWKGPAHDAQQQRFMQAYQKMETLCGLMRQLVQQLETACGRYEDCEENVRQLVDGLHV